MSETLLSRCKARLADRALELGACRARVAGLEISPAAVSRYMRWIENGMHGQMDYLARSAAVRRHPTAKWKNGISAICVAVRYPLRKPARPPTSLGGRVAAYAQGGDYHVTLQRLLQELAQTARTLCPQLGAPAPPSVGATRVGATRATAADFAVCVDTAPVLERTLALACGLGWQGKHGCLIVPEAGGNVVLGELILPFALPPDPPLADPLLTHCQDCRRCIEACPTGALKGDGLLDSRRCLSYLTIEHKGVLPADLVSRLDDRFYGCTACLEACPHTGPAVGGPPTLDTVATRLKAPNLAKRPTGPWVNLAALAESSNRQLARRFAHTALDRLSATHLRRNLCAVLAHYLKFPQTTRRAHAMLTRLSESRSAVVRKQARQALHAKDV
jgi:epoxyqueuosine reductase